ncbi:MAG: beta-hydroxylase [Gemmatales bacterium]|nr:MAG: beta-hydroxylase [Gemmatales bacterium]
MRLPYLLDLTSRLSEGMAKLPAADRRRHGDFLLSSQNPDGGFSGRDGISDLYYTGFALRGLAILDCLTEDVGRKCSSYLRNCLRSEASIVDFFSLLVSCALVQSCGGPDILEDAIADWPDRVAQELESFRSDDGGYAKSADGKYGSTYHTFLVALCYELLGRTVPQPNRIVEFVASRRRDDGGYVEIAAMKRSGTNPTAAAIGTLQILHSDDFPVLTPQVRHVTANFLLGLRSPDGGFLANSRAPLADLLSTFTALWTLKTLDALDQVDTDQLSRFVDQLERDNGGFGGGIWDEATDAEYTFYGLGCRALLAPS